MYMHFAIRCVFCLYACMHEICDKVYVSAYICVCMGFCDKVSIFVRICVCMRFVKRCVFLYS